MANAKELAKFVRSLIPTIHSKVSYYALIAQNLFMRLHRRLVQGVNHHAITAPARNAKVNINQSKPM
ncbi:hypothetical protein A2791_04325 [Candidatus Saccharibacteria bacterium RIFCSPHIGHO2_01_FULL_46_30]|nr:MAG: hypothetical protein A2791_04325 [Candidatus Saccharibacteria bacterium RIFCSPHIGHO2_01_FULL_46_30]